MNKTKFEDSLLVLNNEKNNIIELKASIVVDTETEHALQDILYYLSVAIGTLNRIKDNIK